MGGATGSTATIPLTSFGRASASSHPEVETPECSKRMTGWLIKSSKLIKASVVYFSTGAPSTTGSSVFANWSKIGSPILPFLGPSPGHSDSFGYCGQVLCFVEGGRPPDQTSSIKGEVRGSANVPSASE